MTSRYSVDPEAAKFRRKYPRFPGVAMCVELMWLGRTGGGRREVIHAELVANAAVHLDEMISLYRAYAQQHERLTLLAALEDARLPAAQTFWEDVLAKGSAVEQRYARRALQVLKTM
jgi:hypothetical protein